MVNWFIIVRWCSRMQLHRRKNAFSPKKNNKAQSERKICKCFKFYFLISSLKVGREMKRVEKRDEKEWESKGNHEGNKAFGKQFDSQWLTVGFYNCDALKNMKSGSFWVQIAIYSIINNHLHYQLIIWISLIVKQFKNNISTSKFHWYFCVKSFGLEISIISKL